MRAESVMTASCVLMSRTMVSASKTISQTAKAVLLHFPVLLLVASGVLAQELKVQTEDSATKTLRAADWSALPHRVLEMKDLHDGKPLRFDAIPLKTVLEKAGVPLGDSLRGKRMALCLLAEAAGWIPRGHRSR